MAMDFPTSPINGQEYESYRYDSLKTAWVPIIEGGSSVFSSTTPPTNPITDDLWFKVDEGVLYTYYTDTNSSQWVQVVPNYTLAESLQNRVEYLEDYRYSPNYIINGAMDIAQRGTSINLSSNTLYTLDRWKATASGAVTVSQVSSGLPGNPFAMRLQRNSGNTSTSTQDIVQGIETLNAMNLAGKNITLSFYARAGSDYSPVDKKLFFGVYSGTGTDQNPAVTYTGESAVIARSSTILTSEWQRFSYTGLVSNNATEIKVEFDMTGTGTASTNDYFEITGVQLEEGTVVTPFRRNANSIQAELAACQRYFVAFPITSYFVANPYFAVGLNGGPQNTGTPLPVTMRVPPTSVTNSAGALNVGFIYRNTSAGADISRNLRPNVITTHNIEWLYAAEFNGATTLTANYVQGVNSQIIWVSAEL